MEIRIKLEFGVILAYFSLQYLSVERLQTSIRRMRSLKEGDMRGMGFVAPHQKRMVNCLIFVNFNILDMV
jgi:hypothetical protein